MFIMMLKVFILIFKIEISIDKKQDFLDWFRRQTVYRFCDHALISVSITNEGLWKQTHAKEVYLHELSIITISIGMTLFETHIRSF